MEKMIGVVTLYNPDKAQTLSNISRYAPFLEALVVWDNSAENHGQWFAEPHILYHWTGENTCIAPALNYTWQKAVEGNYSSILIMDQDSTWDDFAAYRKDIEERMSRGERCVFTPFVKGCDTFEPTIDTLERRLFINSGAVIPVEILSVLGPRDEKAFLIDALDHDIAFSLLEKGFKAVCLTRHTLNHSIGYPRLVGPFHLYTPDYNSFRTYHMTRSHIICYRKHKSVMNPEEREYFFKEVLIRKFLRILLLESDKYSRMKAFLKGLYQGLTYPLNH